MFHAIWLTLFAVTVAVAGEPFPPTTTKIVYEVPIFEQTTNYTCGPASMQGIYGYYGLRSDEMTLAKEMGATEKDGTDHHRMAEHARKLGLKAEVKHEQQLTDIAAALARNQVVIIEAQAWGLEAQQKIRYENVWDSGHYMVVIGIDDRNIYFMDPSAESKRGYIPLPEFVSRWRDLGWKGEKLYRTVIYFEGTPKPIDPPNLTAAWIYVP